MSGRLAGKRALIYGGGSGLGLACAEAMGNEGAALFISGRGLERLQAAERRLAALGRVGYEAGDCTNEADVARVTEAALSFLAGIDTLVVSSGVSAIGSAIDGSTADFRKVIDTNMLGPFLAVRAAAAQLMANAPASVILIASITGLVGMRERVAYCGSKAGVLGMTRAMALDFADRGVRVNAISPSLVLTELAQSILARESDPAAALAHRQAQHPTGRLGRPEEIAAAAVHLASDESSWTTGQNLVIDGGLTIV